MRRKIRLLRHHFPVLLEAFIALLIVRLQLTFRGYDRVRGALSPGETAAAPGASPEYDAGQGAATTRPHPVLWAVQQSARLVPGASCLTQAIAAQSLLAKRGEQSTIRVGVRRDDAGGFHAHAWLLRYGRTVLGGEASALDFTPITDLTPIGR